jgi:hypothetical protein
MDRKQFLGNLFIMACVASMPKALRAVVPVAPDVPGIQPGIFKIKLHKDWFMHGDILAIRSPTNRTYGQMNYIRESNYEQFFLDMHDPDRAILRRLDTGVLDANEARLEIPIEWLADDDPFVQDVHRDVIRASYLAGEHETNLSLVTVHGFKYLTPDQPKRYHLNDYYKDRTVHLVGNAMRSDGPNYENGKLLESVVSNR